MSDAAHTPAIRVLFVCVGNTCRSVIAEYLGPLVFHQSAVFESAGIRPGTPPDAANAVYSLRANFNIDASGHVPRDVRSLDIARYDVIIALDPAAASVLSEMRVPEERVQVWKIKDPWGGDLTEYERTAIDIKKRRIRMRAATLRNASG